MPQRDIEAELTRHILELREKLAELRSDVAHLSHDQAAHTGRQERTEQALAHIARSLQAAHFLIVQVQRDIAAMTRVQTPTPLLELMSKWWPAIIGISMLALTVAGRKDIASTLAAIK